MPSLVHCKTLGPTTGPIIACNRVFSSPNLIEYLYLAAVQSAWLTKEDMAGLASIARTLDLQHHVLPLVGTTTGRRPRGSTNRSRSTMTTMTGMATRARPEVMATSRKITGKHRRVSDGPRKTITGLGWEVAAVPCLRPVEEVQDPGLPQQKIIGGMRIRLVAGEWDLLLTEVCPVAEVARPPTSMVSALSRSC